MSSHASRPRFLVWVRDFADRPRPQFAFEADKAGQPLLTAGDAKACVCSFPIADDVAHLSLAKVALLYPCREAAATHV